MLLQLILVALAACSASALTLFTGFGLGTLLLPVFACCMPIEMAVPATALVHAASNLTKVLFLGRHADFGILLRFGLPAVLAAIGGAALLDQLATLPPLATWQCGERTALITPIKLALGLLIGGFAVLELGGRLNKLHFARQHLFLGGLLSGFFGGLSGHQGALRSAALTHAELAPESFVATNAVIGMAVDCVRLVTYATLIDTAARVRLFSDESSVLVITGILAALIGILVGRHFLRKVTMTFVRRAAALMLFATALLLATGLL